MNQQPDNAPKHSSIIAAEINKKATIISAFVTVFTSIFGSVVVALIVGNLTIKASTDAARLSNESQENIVKETIKSQMELASQSNLNQLEIAIKSIENNQKIATNTLKNALDVIERDNALKLQAQIEKEKREKKSNTALALNFFIIDITLRTLYMDGVLDGVDSLQNNLTETKNDESGTLRAITELEMKQATFSRNMVTWEMSQNTHQYISYL